MPALIIAIIWVLSGIMMQSMNVNDCIKNGNFTTITGFKVICHVEQGKEQ